MKCIYCGVQNETGSAICSNCGGALQTFTATTGSLEFLARELNLPLNKEKGNDTKDQLAGLRFPGSEPSTEDIIPLFDKPPEVAPRKSQTPTPPPPGLRLKRMPVDIDTLTQPRQDAHEHETRLSRWHLSRIGEIKCARCRLTKPAATAQRVRFGRRVCYDCYQQLLAEAGLYRPGSFINSLSGFGVGLLFGLVCAVIFALVAWMTREHWLELFFLAGLVIGSGTRAGADHRHGILVQIAAACAALLGWVLCLYASLVGFNYFKFLSLSEFQEQYSRAGVPSFWDGLSLGAGLLIAFMIPMKPGAREVD
jgi:hypothetical protein